MSGLVVIILTLNEQANLDKALDSIGDRAPVIVVDSGSTDSTQEIARNRGAELHEHAFVDYARQRNFALELVSDRFEWTFFLDADEELTPQLWADIEAATKRDDIDGAYVGLTFHALGRELKHGSFARAAILRLMRTSMARFTRGSNERVDDSQMRVMLLAHKLKHTDAKPLASWFRKHVGYAEREAQHYLDDRETRRGLEGFGLRTKAGRMIGVRWAYNKMPLFVRPWVHYGRTMVWQNAWRDGVPGILYAGMQSLWYPMVIDLLIFEEQRRRRDK
ncbi:MAG: glycosyltransferase family 2 protein [Nannocystaceae bacterium]|nr:glycosyltransferase family 2 protein [Nannocystaceae bacterium]